MRYPIQIAFDFENVQQGMISANPKQ